MIFSNETYAKHRLKQGYEAINDADTLLANGRPSSAIELALRAARCCAEAALVSEDNKNVRADSLLFLAAGFVRDGRLSIRSYNAFRTLMDLCVYANESDFPIVNRSEVNIAIDNIKQFVREMGNIVKKQVRT